MDKIIVAIDGSEHGNRAVEKAKEIGSKFNSLIILVNVAETIHPIIVDNTSRLSAEIKEVAESKERSKTLLAQTKADLEVYGDKVETVMLEGDPPHELIKYIESSDADLVILGSHGVKGLRQFMLGSVVSKVVHHINKPILIVR